MRRIGKRASRGAHELVNEQGTHREWGAQERRARKSTPQAGWRPMRMGRAGGRRSRGRARPRWGVRAGWAGLLRRGRRRNVPN